MLKIQIPMLRERDFVLFARVVYGLQFKVSKIYANRCIIIDTVIFS